MTGSPRFGGKVQRRGRPCIPYFQLWLNVSRVEVGEKHQDSLEFQLFVVSMHVCLDFFGVPWYTKRRESCILQSTFSSWCIGYFHIKGINQSMLEGTFDSGRYNMHVLLKVVSLSLE